MAEINFDDLVPKKSVSGRPLYSDPRGGVYSEKTVTFPIDSNWYTFPSVDGAGNIMSEDSVADYVRKNGPVDPLTGERFPSFKSRQEAEAYARQRSGSRLPPKGRVSFDDLVPAQSRPTVIEAARRMAERPDERIAGAFEDAQGALPQVGRGRAVAEGFTQGATLGFGDEIGAAMDIPLDALMSGDGGDAYRVNLAKRRASLEAAQGQYPGTTIAGEVGGALATAPLLPVARVAQGAGMGARVAAGARTGAAYGAGYGAGTGEGLEDRALGALTGGVAGVATGGAAPVVIGGVQALGRGVSAVARPAVNAVRAARNPEKEAARRVGGAMAADDAIPQPRLSLADETRALSNGQPVFNLDRGGETVRALARSTANTSPQGRAVMETAVQDRFQTQGGRVMDVVRKIAGNTTNADARVNLQRQAQRANRPAYGRAYNAPSAQSLWDDSLDQLATAPIVQDAIRQAAITGRNSAALDGFPPLVSPFRIDKTTGRIVLKEGVTPSLRFWDHVKRNLDGMGTREAKQAARVLRDHIDTIVPEYKTARAGAASFFDAEDALDAGEKFVTSRMDNDVARAGIQKMSAPERKLFMEGFADKFVRQVAETADRRNVINSIFKSPAARERVEIAMGPKKAQELEAFVRIEDLLDRARPALSGNSTTARQLVELGLAGGAGGYGYMTGDWTTSGTLLGAMLARRGAKAGIAHIEKGVAMRIGEMLASPNPQQVQRGLKIISNNPRYMDALRNLDIPAAAGASQMATDAVAN